MARAIEGERAGIVDVHAFQRGGEAVGIALAADLSIGENVQPGSLLGADGEQGRVVLCFLQPRVGYPPQLPGTGSRWEATAELGTIDEPVGLRVAAYQGGGEQHAVFRPVRRLKFACYTLP